MRDYLERYPNGKYADSAQREIARLEFEAVQNTTDTAAFEEFLRKYPSGGYHDQVLARFDDITWERGGRGKDVNGSRAYLQGFPNGRHAEEADRRLDQLTSVTETKPPRPQPSAPSAPFIDNNKAILEVLAQYQKAYEDKSIEELQKIWPGMSHQQVSGVGDFFKNANSVKMTYSISGGREITGDEAVTLQQSLSYLADGKWKKPKRANLIVRLKKLAPDQRASPAWEIESIR